MFVIFAGHVTCRLCDRIVELGSQQQQQHSSDSATINIEHYEDGVYSELQDTGDDDVTANRQPFIGLKTTTPTVDNDERKLRSSIEDGGKYPRDNVDDDVTTRLNRLAGQVRVERSRFIFLLVLVVVFGAIALGAISIAALTMVVTGKTTRRTDPMPTDSEAERRLMPLLQTADGRITDLRTRIGRLEDEQRRTLARLDEDRDKTKSRADEIEQQVKRIESQIEEHDKQIAGLKKNVQRLTEMAEQVYRAVFRSPACRPEFSWTVNMLALSLCCAWVGLLPFGTFC